jgi:hypothetical protein
VKGKVVEEVNACLSEEQRLSSWAWSFQSRLLWDLHTSSLPNSRLQGVSKGSVGIIFIGIVLAVQASKGGWIEKSLQQQQPAPPVPAQQAKTR